MLLCMIFINSRHLFELITSKIGGMLLLCLKKKVTENSTQHSLKIISLLALVELSYGTWISIFFQA